jgi:geranylgeranyl pyrophosphate synthase
VFVFYPAGGKERSTYVKELEELRNVVECGLSAVVDQLESLNPFKSSLCYLCSTGGKRLRPLLLLALQLDLDSRSPINLNIVIALELLHQASLLHDDLPALDDDDVRRGQPTIHVKFTEHEAILLGDWLYGKAMLLVTTSNLDPTIVIKIASELSSLWCYICEGQELDMRDPQDLDSLKNVRFFKTSSFFETITRVAVLLSSVDTGETYSIARWGRDLGDLFQEVDDLLDRDQQLGFKGRPYSSDIKNQKGNVGLQFSTVNECREMKEELFTRLLSFHDSDFKLTKEVLKIAFKPIETLLYR